MPEGDLGSGVRCVALHTAQRVSYAAVLSMHHTSRRHSSVDDARQTISQQFDGDAGRRWDVQTGSIAPRCRHHRVARRRPSPHLT